MYVNQADKSLGGASCKKPLDMQKAFMHLKSAPKKSSLNQRYRKIKH